MPAGRPQICGKLRPFRRFPRECEVASVLVERRVSNHVDVPIRSEEFGKIRALAPGNEQFRKTWMRVQVQMPIIGQHGFERRGGDA